MGTQKTRIRPGCGGQVGAGLEGEDLEVAFAGEDYGEETAVGGEAVFTDGEAVEEHAGFRFNDRDFGVGRIGAKLGDAHGDEVGGFFLDRALEIEARLVVGPLEDTEPNTQPGDADGDGEIADFENFLIEKIGDFGAAGRNENAAGVGVERGDFPGVLGEKFQALETRRAIEVAVMLDGDGGIAAGNAGGALEGAAFEGFSGGAAGDVEKLQGEETLGVVAGGEIDEGLIVAEPEGILSLHDERIFAGGMEFASGVFE